jgi:hypothetical protein
MTLSQPDFDLNELNWRRSSFASPSATTDVLECALGPDGNTYLRNPDEPGRFVSFTPQEMDDWIKGCKAGEFDDIR